MREYWLEPPQLSKRKLELLDELDELYDRRKKLEDLPQEWEAEQEDEYKAIERDIKSLELTIEDTP
jgi:hypothetical protein